MNLELAAALCREFEGFSARPYLCPAGVWTIGYGSTQYLSGDPVTRHDPSITREYAEELLIQSLRRVYAPGVIRACPGVIGDSRRLNALVDFAYNLGVGRLQTSTLRRRVNERNWEAARHELRRWTRGGGRVLPGLVRRREAECALI